MPPMVAASGPHPIAATINGSGAISAPEMIEANISAEALPAAMAMRTITIISCPAPFERLEVFSNPNHRQPGDREPYEDFFDPRRVRRGSKFFLANNVRQQTEE